MEKHQQNKIKIKKYIYMFIHSLSSTIVFSLNFFSHLVFLCKNKHFIQYFVTFIPKHFWICIWKSIYMYLHSLVYLRRDI